MLQYCFCFMFSYFGHEASGILPPWPELEFTSPALEGEVLTTGQPGKSHSWDFLIGTVSFSFLNVCVLLSRVCLSSWM